MRENRWVTADLRGKGSRIRTVAVRVWVKIGINAWQNAGRVEEGPLFRSIRKGGKVGESLSDWAIWAVVTEAAKEIGIEYFGAHDCGARARSCAARLVVIWSKLSSYSVTPRSRSRSATWVGAGDRRRRE